MNRVLLGVCLLSLLVSVANLVMLVQMGGKMKDMGDKMKPIEESMEKLQPMMKEVGEKGSGLPRPGEPDKSSSRSSSSGPFPPRLPGQ